VGADRERQAVAIHDRHDFHAFSTLGRPTSAPPPFAITKLASMKHSSSSSTPRSVGVAFAALRQLDDSCRDGFSRTVRGVGHIEASA
jgi:hypothetical protein